MLGGGQGLGSKNINVYLGSFAQPFGKACCTIKRNIQYTPLNLPGGFLRMKVQSLCLVSSMPRYPQALQEFPMVCFLALMC